MCNLHLPKYLSHQSTGMELLDWELRQRKNNQAFLKHMHVHKDNIRILYEHAQYTIHNITIIHMKKTLHQNSLIGFSIRFIIFTPSLPYLARTSDLIWRTLKGLVLPLRRRLFHSPFVVNPNDYVKDYVLT